MKFNSAPFNKVVFDGDTQQGSTDASVTLTGVSAAGSVGSLSVSLDLPLTGVSATGQVGTLALTADSTIALVGVAATGQVGALSIVSSSLVSLDGVSTAGQAGSFDLAVYPTVNLLGVAGAGQVGDLSFSTDNFAALVGVESAAAVGAFDISASLELSGVQTAGEVGDSGTSVEVSAIELTGVHTAGEVGELQGAADAPAETPSGLDGAWAPRIFEDRTYRQHSEARLIGVSAVASAGPLLASVELQQAVAREVLVEVSHFAKLALSARLPVDGLIRMSGVSTEMAVLRAFELLPPELVLDEELEELALLAATL